MFLSLPTLVASINGVFTAGSGLESTCLVFAYGLDLYWTRITPSRMFDVLKEDFDYWFILGTLGILVLVTIVSQRLASIKMLRQVWQWEDNTWHILSLHWKTDYKYIRTFRKHKNNLKTKICVRLWEVKNGQTFRVYRAFFYWVS